MKPQNSRAVQMKRFFLAVADQLCDVSVYSPHPQFFQCTHVINLSVLYNLFLPMFILDCKPKIE